mmetsp:Transcript_1714/g.5991  ORF Transcript_1714/g.5991 Transcript_1714/m.5991 type:complete len:238 (-) Transcript_1714:2621-3334(-)
MFLKFIDHRFELCELILNGVRTEPTLCQIDKEWVNGRFRHRSTLIDNLVHIVNGLQHSVLNIVGLLPHLIELFVNLFKESHDLPLVGVFLSQSIRICIGALPRRHVLEHGGILVNERSQLVHVLFQLLHEWRERLRVMNGEPMDSSTTLVRGLVEQTNAPHNLPQVIQLVLLLLLVLSDEGVDEISGNDTFECSHCLFFDAFCGVIEQAGLMKDKEHNVTEYLCLLLLFDYLIDEFF